MTIDNKNKNKHIRSYLTTLRSDIWGVLSYQLHRIVKVMSQLNEYC